MVPQQYAAVGICTSPMTTNGWIFAFFADELLACAQSVEMETCIKFEPFGVPWPCPIHSAFQIAALLPEAT
jgi:hypothetical protein